MIAVAWNDLSTDDFYRSNQEIHARVDNQTVLRDDTSGVLSARGYFRMNVRQSPLSFKPGAGWKDVPNLVYTVEHTGTYLASWSAAALVVTSNNVMHFRVRFELDGVPIVGSEHYVGTTYNKAGWTYNYGSGSCALITPLTAGQELKLRCFADGPNANSNFDQGYMALLKL